MRQARRIEWLRLTAFVALGSLVLHQTRYVVGQGGAAGEALARDGHAHMSLALPITLSIAVALAAIALLLAAFARPRRTPARASDPRRRALRYALALLGAFCAQELVEGVLYASHPGGLEALLGHGGAAVPPMAVVQGCLISLLVEALGTAEERVAGCLCFRRLAPVSSPHLCYLEPDVERLAGLGLVFGFACRPPPSLTTLS
jgi:hypothetical protein